MSVIVFQRKGQALIETLLSLPVLLLLFAGVTGTAYMGFLKYMAGELLYEALVCQATEESTPPCDSEFRKKIESLLIIGQIRQFSLSNQGRNIDGILKLHFPLGIRLEISESLSLPLKF